MEQLIGLSVLLALVLIFLKTIITKQSVERTIKLDKENGQLVIGDLEISPNLSPDDIEKLKDRYSVCLSIENASYKTFSIRNLDSREAALGVTFKMEKLQMVSMHLGTKHDEAPFIITEKKKAMIQEKLAAIGGAKTYFWGRIEYAEDNKGGDVSIVISYN